MIKIQFIIKGDDILDQTQSEDLSMCDVATCVYWLEKLKQEFLSMDFEPTTSIKKIKKDEDEDA